MLTKPETMLRLLIRESLKRNQDLRAVTNRIYQMIKDHLPGDLLDPSWSRLQLDWPGGESVDVITKDVEGQERTDRVPLPPQLYDDLTSLEMKSLKVEVDAGRKEHSDSWVDGAYYMTDRMLHVRAHINVRVDPERTRWLTGYDESKHRRRVYDQMRRLFETILHELTHARQAAQGTGPKSAPIQALGAPYFLQSWEVEAWVKAAREQSRSTGKSFDDTLQDMLDTRGIPRDEQREILNAWYKQYNLQYKGRKPIDY